MNTKHPHAELMMQYAQDAMETHKPWERWECRRDRTREWEPLDMYPAWHKDFAYRRKPRTIVINGHEVPEPVRWELAMDTEYWTPYISWEREWSQQWEWSCDEIDALNLSRGLIHLTKEAAEAHAKALLSFTATE